MTRTCISGLCGEANVPVGTHLAQQTPGDCKVDQCDGNGGVVSAVDDSDLPDDGNDCTDDVCTGGVASHSPRAAQSACGAGGALKCDGNGNCLDCLAPSDCGADTECQSRTCILGVCGVLNVPANTNTSAQVDGDCKVRQCNGQGGVSVVPDDNDLPVDGDPCTRDVCSGGVASHPSAQAGTACAADGGATLCDGAGNCAQCVVASDCPGTDTECAQRACNSGVCGTTYAQAGTVLNAQTPGDCQKQVCDGSGNAVPQADDGDLPDDSNPCTADLCSNGVPSHSSVANGSSCGASLTCLNGTCTGCAQPSDCPGADNECQTRTCTAGLCGFDFAPNGTALSAQTPNDCQKLVCDGTGKTVSVPDNADVPVDDGNPCTSETCVAGAPSHPNKADSTPCSDSNACTTGDSCQAGVCQSGTPVVCGASDACHVAGTCDPSSGLCTNPSAPDGTSCSDGNACTTGDSCQAGACVGGTPVTCSAGDQCHAAGVCDPSTGQCSNPAAQDGTACNDGNACTQSDTCQAGICTGGNPVTCTASDQCHVAGTCDTSTGQCSNPAATNGTACNDSDACTQTDTCQAGVCTGSNPVTCTASDQCHVAGTCNPSTGQCSNPTASNGTACNDGNACSQTDTCQAGVCTGSNPVVCTAQDQCHVAGTCNPGTGQCSNPAASNGTACNDGNSCTQTDTCQAGVCTGSNPVTCTGQDACHGATCNPATGACSQVALTGNACDDGRPCTSGDTCQAGVCTPQASACGCNQDSDCAAPGQCQASVRCDIPTGACVYTNKGDGVACNDGNACTQSDTCQAGVCTGSNPVVCSASDQCHVAGTCNATTGQCSNPLAANGTACSDGNACTQTDTCQAGVCTGSNPVTCTASDQCHVAGTCNTSTGVCSNPVASNGTACNDGNACTQTDSCQAGVCIGSNPVTCSASDQCHVAGTCNPGTGQCSNPVASNGTACNDGNACTQTDSCQAGVCTGSNPVVCTASDQCHVAGTCNTSTGQCSNPVASNGTACNDSDACTQTDTCQAGVCTGSNPITCTASDQCHVAGACNPATGQCTNPSATDGTSCSDGNGCTLTDTCQAGTCTGGTAVTCSAQDACHVAGTCSPGTGQCSNPTGNDGSSCSASGFSGVCQTGSCATCGDGIHNGTESGIDCGGGTCPTCGPGQGCNGNGDCQSGVCTGGVCQSPSCFDSVKNGSETGTDCGGGTCPACADGQGCSVSSDCTSLVCTGGICQTPLCTDGVKNGTETGIDCGGSCSACPAVVSTTPADGATGVAVSSTIAVNFNSSAMDASTLTTQTSSGACSGNVQVSTDNFATCIGIGSASLAGSTLTLTPAPGLSYGSTYMVKVTSAVKDTKGNAVPAYTSTTGISTTTLSASCSSSVVISQVYASGGNTSAPYNHDFIELHNNGGSMVNIGNWAVGYQSSAGPAWTVSAIPSGTTIAAGGYVLIQEGTTNATVGASLPTPVIVPGTMVNMGAAQGKVALAMSAAAFTSGCPSSNFLDYVQWGTTILACGEGSPASAATAAASSIFRNGSGCTDTNQNSTDFVVGAVLPRNSSSAAVACSCTLNESNTTLEGDYCTLNTTGTLTLSSGSNTGAILGELYESGITDNGQSGWVAQVGYGPDNVNPEWQSGWTWFSASYVGQTGFGNHDNQYSGSFNAPAPGPYRYAYRMSSDGVNWTYCDANGAGSNSSQTFEVTQLPILTVQ